MAMADERRYTKKGRNEPEVVLPARPVVDIVGVVDVVVGVEVAVVKFKNGMEKRNRPWKNE